MQSIADSLYGSAAPAPALSSDTPLPSDNAPQPVSEPAHNEAPEVVEEVKPAASAESFEIVIPADVQALRKAEGNGLYSRISGLESVALEAAMEGAGLPADVIAASALEYRHMAADVGASADQTAQLLATMQAFTNAPPTPEQATEMRSEAAELLTAKYGAESAGLLDLTKRMVSRDPRAHHLLESTGAGNDPRTVMLLVELAVRQRAQGRLK